MKVAGSHQTIQTHNTISVAAGGTSASNWFDCDGHDKVAVTFLNDAATESSADVEWSNDGTSIHGTETAVIPTGTNANKLGETTVKARYARLVAKNGDGVAAHTVSTWVYLKN